MEIQFRKFAVQCLRKACAQNVTQEQTQEVRLPDGMADIGRVLGCWGQLIIRGKEWRGSGMSVSGGVMAWVMYAPEDGHDPECVECWIPFQMRWDFPQTQRDGFIFISPRIKSMDARSVSARKLMVRACVSAVGEALEPVEEEVSVPEGVSTNIQLLKESYPVELPVESGEKLFDMEEALPLPEQQPKISKLLRYEMLPSVLEDKVMAGRLVLRGKCGIHILYRDETGGIQSYDLDVPFSQYTQLDRDYSANAQARIKMLVTALEMDVKEDHIAMRCSLAGQYVIYDRMLVEITEDAYSPGRSVEVEKENLMLPARLDTMHQEAEVTGQLECDCQRIVDVFTTGDIPAVRCNGDNLELAAPAQFQVLYYDPNGMLQSSTARGEYLCTMPSDCDNRTEVTEQMSFPQGFQTGGGISVSAQCQMDVAVFSQQGLPMVTQLKVGQLEEPDPGRPSLILRPMGDGRLWDIAKACNTTVDAIQKANKLTDEPEKGRMLLIPVP